MKVWQIFNRYRESVNGEEQAVLNTHELLNARGIQSELMFEDSKTVSGLGGKLVAAGSGIYSRAAYQRMRSAIRANKPDVVHAHNLLPLLSPAILKACRDESVPTVVTAHSFFLTCPIYTHFTNGQACNRCRESSELACVINNCRNSYLESAAYALRTWTTRTLGLYEKYSTAVVALTNFARVRLIEYGFTADRVSIVSNFSSLQGAAADVSNNHYVAFAGRLNEVKGINVLLEAAKLTGLPIKIAGTGVEKENGDSLDNVEFLGVLNREQMLGFYRKARFVVVPSVWYEMCPLVVVEALSLGLPVIASRIGGLPELVEEGETGLLFKTGDADELAQQMNRLWSDSGLCAKFGTTAQHRALSSYSPDAHFRALTSLYECVVAE